MRVVSAAGLDAAEARQVLAEDVYADEVRIEERTAADLGATGVPFFVVDRRYGIAGAQPADVLLQVLDRAWQEHPPLTLLTPAADAGGDGTDGTDGPDGTARTDEMGTDACAGGSCAV